MIVIPAINCKDEKCVKERLGLVKRMNADWVHFDVSDGRFDPVVNWNEPSLLTTHYSLPPNIEVHLMVEKPEDFIPGWLEAGVKRIIIHLESDFDTEKAIELCRRGGAALMIAVKPDTPLKKLVDFMSKYQRQVGFVQFLAVDPGKSGQSFKKEILDKIKFFRDLFPGAQVEVDGGVNNETIELVKGWVDIAVSGSYIFDNQNPTAAYKTLRI